MAQPIYKILRPHEWQLAKSQTFFDGAPVDIKDGYIHFSTWDQLAETGHKHFGDSDQIHVLAVSPDLLPEEALKWEPSRGGHLFPHLYAPLPMNTVLKHWQIDRGPDNLHDFTCVPRGGSHD